MRSIRRTLLPLLIVVAAILGFQTPASAVQYYAHNGMYGGVTPYKVSHYNQPTSGGYIHPGLLVPGPSVTRSNGSAYAQKITVLYQITRLHSDGLRSVNHHAETYWLNSGTTKLPDYKASYGAFGGTFHVRIALGWDDAYGRSLGSRSLAYTGSTNDYACTYSHYVGCQVHNGWITIS